MNPEEFLKIGRMSLDQLHRYTPASTSFLDIDSDYKEIFETCMSWIKDMTPEEKLPFMESSPNNIDDIAEYFG